MTRIFVNGQEVSKKDLKGIEIKSESLDRILAGKLRKEDTHERVQSKILA